MAIPRRQRRRPARWLLAGVLVTAVVLVVNASRHGSLRGRDNVLAYLDQIRPDVQNSSAQGLALADVRANAVTLGRDGITRILDRLASAARTTLIGVSALSPPPSVRIAHAYLVAALGVRSRAVDEARTALASALAQGPPDPAVVGLVAVGKDIGAGDRNFALFVDSLPHNVVNPTPSSTWVTDAASWDTAELNVFVTTLRSSTSLTPIHDLAVVTFQTDPSAVGTDNGAAVIPPTRTLQVAIVVADAGNLPERHATVSATLTLNGYGTTESVRDFVDLVPGQRLAIKVGSLHPISGTSAILTVTISAVPGETNLANNTQQMSVEFG